MLPSDRHHSSSVSKPAAKVAKVLNANSAEWLTGGPVGSKDCVLQFRLSALYNTGLVSPTDDATVINTAPTLAGRSSKILEPTNQNGATMAKKSAGAASPFADKVLLKKRAHESLSSSDTSISSSCDDAAEVDAVAEKNENTASAASVAVDTEPVPNGRSVELLGVPSGASDGKENRSDDPAVLDVSEMPAKSLQINYRFANTETKLLRRILNSHGLTEVDETQDFNLLWTGSHVKTDTLRFLQPHQRINHFPRSFELTRKDRLYKNIVKMQHLRGIKHFDIVPQSFMLPLEYRSLVHEHRASPKMPWIVKPAASSRGRGIFLVHSPEQIPLDESVLVSRYISNPLCIDGHKCDVRLYVAVTSFDPLIVYMYEEGLVRLATVKYDKSVENLWNPCMHLCNYSINKFHSDYIKATESCEDVGHKWTFSALLRHLKQQGCDTKALMANVEDIVVKSIMACTQSIASACRMFVASGSNCFELYGFDILIDDQLVPWLLEVNMSPSLGIDTPLDTKVKASMITDLMTLVGIPAIDWSSQKPTSGQPKWSRFRNAAGLGKCRKSTSVADVATKARKASNASASQLTTEEMRIVRQARSQYERRGGFVRIFPTADSQSKYGQFLDPLTGIPMSTIPVSTTTFSMILPHNYNQMLHKNLFCAALPLSSSSSSSSSSTVVAGVHATRLSSRAEEHMLERMAQYERVLNADAALLLTRKACPKSVDDAIRLRRQMRGAIEAGAEFTHLQARRLFYRYLECVLMRLATDPPKTSQQEKWILKFITRSEGVRIKTPSFIKNPQQPRVNSKDRSALVAKLLGDYLEVYLKDSEAYVDDFDRSGFVPARQFDEFIALAQEADLEATLTLHTNITQSLPFLNQPRGFNVNQVPPPIPTGATGFLRALPSMVGRGISNTVIDTYYRSLPSSNTSMADSSPDDPAGPSGRVNNADKNIMSTSVTLGPSTSKVKSNTIKRRSVSQTAIHR